MDKQLWTVIGLLLTNAGFLFGMWKYMDARIGRVFERFDEHKNHIADKYVQKEYCKLLHDTASTNLLGVELRISEKFDKLEKRVESSFQMILDIIKK